MISKKFLVTGLVLSLMVSGGSVVASQENLASTVSGETAVVSEVGKPYAIIGDLKFEYVVGKVTVDELSAYFKSLKVVDSEGNDLGMSDLIVSLDAKSKARTLESDVAYLNEKADGFGSKGFIIGLVGYYGVSNCVDCVPISESESSLPVITIADGGFHFYKGQTITAEDLLSKITVIDSSGKENAELKNSILFSNGAPLQRLSAEEEAAFINETIASYGYDDWEKTGLYIGVYVDGYNYKIADVFAARAYFDAEVPSDITGNVVYSTHVQNVGWQKSVADGKMSGTSGESLRLEGIKIKSGIEDLGVRYATHVENIGWQNPVADGTMSGTSAKGLRLEAIRINLTGEQAENYDVYYRVHAQNVGWMGWASNGADSGTAGYGYRLEGIEIQIVEKGANSPGSTDNAFIQK